MADAVGHAIQVDFWENQRFKPLQGGWTVPWTGGLPHYSDITGAVTVSKEIFSDSSIALAHGWEWESDWRPDSSGTYGQTDSDGWAYAGSFDTLVKLSMSRQLRSERSTTNIARRRRWVRTRVCTDSSTSSREKERTKLVKFMLENSTRVSQSYQHIQSQLTEHHEGWIESVNQVKVAADANLTEIEKRLEYMVGKLTQLRSFLADTGEVEAQYVASLQSLSAKWSPAKIQEKDAKSLPAKQFAPSSDQSFFQVLSTSRSAIIDRKSALVKMLQVYLPTDVDHVVQSVRALLNEAIETGAIHRQAMESAVANAKTQITATIQTLDLAANRITGSSEVLSDSLTRIGSWEDPTEHPYVSFSKILAKQAGLAGSDSWLGVHTYCRTVLSSHSALQQAYSFIQHMCDALKTLVERVSVLLQSILKAMVHEEFKVYEAALEMLAACGDHLDVLLINKNNGDMRPAKRMTPWERRKILPWKNPGRWSMWPGLLALCEAKHGVLQYYPIAEGDAAQQSQARAELAAAEDRWRTAMVIVTFDSFLHIVDSQDGTGTASVQSYNAKLLFSADLRGAIVEPLFLAFGGRYDAFEVRFASSTTGKTTTTTTTTTTTSSSARRGSFSSLSTSDRLVSRSSLGGLGSVHGGKADDSATTSGKIASMIFLSSSAEEVADWMQTFSQQFS